MPFEHKALIALVQHVSPRTEKHGDEDKLAVDVKLMLKAGVDDEQWDAVLADLLDMPADAVANFVMEESSRYRNLPLARHFDHHTVVFHPTEPGLFDNGEPVASLTHAKVNNFNVEFATEKLDDRVLFRVQALADGDAVGNLAAQMGQWVRLEIRHEAPQDDPDAENEEEETEGAEA